MSSTAVVAKVSGAAFVIRGGQEIALSQGMELLVSDSIRTGMNGQCELRFADDTEVQLSPMSQVQIQDFAFNPEAPAENSFAVHMMEGLVRTVSGEVVKLNPEGFALSTPLGTAGIRGTTVIAQIFPTHVVFMVTEMGAGNTVVVNSIFGGDLTILMPGQGAEISLTEQQRITLIDSMPENMRDAVRDFFENKYDDLRSSHDNSILLFGDLEFLSAIGAEDVARGVGMLSAESEDILIELLHELGVEQPEFFLEAVFGSGSDELGEYITLWGDAGNNTLVPSDLLFGDDFKNLRYDIRGFAGSDEMVSFNGTDTVYGGQGNGSDTIMKISPAIGAGNLLVGGDRALDVVTLDSDRIILRSLGANADNENGWLTLSDTDYGATVMSGGSVVGSAVDLSNCSGGDNVIKLYGSMTGGSIYGSAVNSTNNTLAGNTIIISQGLDTDNVTPIGGDLDGGTIYGDAQSITGGTAGSDYIFVADMKSGTIYGDAASGSGYTPGNNEISVTNTMSGGTIHAGNGNDTVDVGTMSGGTINAGDGDDEVLVDTISSGTINAGSGSNVVSIDTAEGGTLLLSAASKAYITDLDGSLTVANGTVAQNVEVTNLNSGGTLTTGAGADVITVTELNSGGTINTGAGADVVNITTANGGTLVLSAAAKAVITDLDGAVTASNDTVAQNVEVTNINSGGTLTTGLGRDSITVGTMKTGGTLNSGAGNDTVSIGVYEGGQIKLGNGNLSITTQNAELTIVNTDIRSLSIKAGAGTNNDISFGNVSLSSLLSLDPDTSGKTLKITSLSHGGSGGARHVELGGDNTLEVDTLGTMLWIYGDSSWNISDATGGDSVITINSMLKSSCQLVGDAQYMTSKTGGNDIITVNGGIDGTASPSYIMGDGHYMYEGSTGGGDTITVDGDVYRGIIYGDAMYLSDLTESILGSTGGADFITITGAMDSLSRVYGDSSRMLRASEGGKDSIWVGTLNDGAIVCGDGDTMEGVTSLSLQGLGGPDQIFITTAMNGGTVCGDGLTMTYTKGGDDKIYIQGPMYGGAIYGEGQTLTNHTPGDNYIEIAEFAGTGAKKIFAGDGEDTVVIKSVAAGAENITVHLNQSGTSGDGQTDYLDLSGMTVLGGNATITVNGFDANADKIVCNDTNWSALPGSADTGTSFTLTHNSGATLTLLMSDNCTWGSIVAEAFP